MIFCMSVDLSSYGIIVGIGSTVTASLGLLLASGRFPAVFKGFAMIVQLFCDRLRYTDSVVKMSRLRAGHLATP